jgi:hypothetical protein
MEGIYGYIMSKKSYGSKQLTHPLRINKNSI